MTPEAFSVHDVRSYVQWFDAAFEPAFCAQLIESFERSPQLQVRNGAGFRAGLETSSWTEINLTPHADQAFLGFFFAQIDKYMEIYNARLKLTLPIPSRPVIDNLVMKHYRAGTNDNFQPHYDSVDERTRRYMVFLWYLNDVAEGGETEFCDLGIKVAPRTGRLLMFPPYWMYQHVGSSPRSNDKYIVSTYLMFKA
jgi:hypothetical protein